MKIGVPKETQPGERRVAASPDTVTKIAAMGLEVIVESGAGEAAGFTDQNYKNSGARLGSREESLSSEIVFKVAGPSHEECQLMHRGSLLVSHLDVCGNTEMLQALAAAGIDSIAIQKIPRISRAQSMDALSSQANIAGYRAVIEASYLYQRFYPLMMTASGSAKPARVYVLGAGVAGLQAIATAKRLGAQVYAYDVRPQVREEIQSLGAKFVELDLQSDGEGEGGYAKELDEAGKQKQMQLLTAELQKADVIISTALIPCRPAPVLITEEAVRGMRNGSVIIDLAAANGGNCPLTELDKTIVINGVTICGFSNLPSIMATDASTFYARNLLNLLPLLIASDESGISRKDLHADEVTESALVVENGVICGEN